MKWIDYFYTIFSIIQKSDFSSVILTSKGGIRDVRGGVLSSLQKEPGCLPKPVVCLLPLVKIWELQ